MNSRECEVLKHILAYCREIKEMVSRFGDSLETNGFGDEVQTGLTIT